MLCTRLSFGSCPRLLFRVLPQYLIFPIDFHQQDGFLYKSNSTIEVAANLNEGEDRLKEDKEDDYK